jgi:sugar phosphate isomerase/epimerase
MPNAVASRRSFLAASALTCGSAALGGGLATIPRVASAKDPLPLNLGIQMYSLRAFPVDKALDLVKELGLTRVEFYPGMLPVTDDAEKIAAFKKNLADRGLTLSGYGVNHFGKNGDANRKIFEFVKALGTSIILADPSPDSFENLNELVKEFDMRIAIHNHGPKHRYNKVLDVVSAVEKYDQRIGACADLGHYLRSGERPVDVIRALEGRLYGIHLKDHAEMKEGARGVILGKGLIDVPAVMEALVAVKFPADGSLSLEYEENAKDPLADLKECVATAKAALGQA